MASTRIITVNNKDLILNAYHSNLNIQANSGDSTIDVYSILNFSTNQILMIGEPGNEGTEIISTHGSTSPTGNTITLASALTKDHPKDTNVYVILFDQVEFSYSATISGANSVLGVSNVDSESEETQYIDITHSSGYYFTRFKNSIFGTFADYSDAIPFDGLDPNTVGYIFNSAMTDLKQNYTKELTYEKLLEWSNEMLRLVRGKLKKWNGYEEFDYVLGSVSQGVRSYVLPDSVYSKNNNQSFMNVRIGNTLPLLPMDHSEYLQATEDISYTEVTTAPSIGDTSIILDDTADLDDSGSVDIFVSGTKYTITYTTNTRSTNTLSGIPASGDGSITYAFPIDSQVWQNIREEEPMYFSVWDGYMYIWPIINSDFEGRNIIVDFQTDITSINSDSDIIVGPRFDMLKHYLKWKIRAFTEKSGVEDLQDPAYFQFREILTDAIKNDRLNEEQAFRPRSYAIYGGRKHNSRR